MMKRIVPALVFASMLAAPALAADLPSRTAGLWQSVTTVIGPNGQPLQNASGVVTLSCVDALNDQKFFTSEQSDCSSLTVSGGGSSYNIDGACQAEGRPLKIHETLLYVDSKNIQLKAVYASKEGQMTVNSRLQWLGGCLEGMQPGDEGSLTSGAFNKSDNINDKANQ
jgi:hypothetical protein